MIQHVYIHIPFCTSKCGYCNFFSLPYKVDEVNAYISLLINEIDTYHQILDINPTTIYFGGGTPSLLSPDNIESILNKFDLTHLLECTVEINPVGIGSDYLKALSRLPVNRISAGTQSFDNHYLKCLDRKHTLTDSYRTIHLLREHGFENLSIDLMYGLGQRTMSQSYQKKMEKMTMIENVKAIDELKPEHVSCYCLSLEDYSELKTDGFEESSDEISSSSYRFLCNKLEEIGLKQYEISNFAVPNMESQHNISCWELQDYLGLGAGAHGFIDDIRYCNPRSMSEYRENVEKHKAYPNKKVQTKAELMSDYVIQGLRLTKGINLNAFQQRYGINFLDLYHQTLSKYSEFLEIDRNRVKLKSKSYFVSNEILTGFLL